MNNFELDMKLGENHILYHASLDHYEIKCRVLGKVYPISRIDAKKFQLEGNKCPLCYEPLRKEGINI